MKNPIIYSLVFVAIVAFASAETLIRPGSHVMFTALGNNANYQTFGTKTLSSKAFDFVFSAQANNDIHVAFMCGRNTRTSEAYEIVIGGWRNTRSVIRKGTQGEEVAVSQGSRASCDSLEAYWVTYEQGQLSVYADTEESHLTSHKAAFLSAKLPQLSCDRLTVAFGAWNMPVHFTKVIYDKDEEYTPPNQSDQATLNSFIRALEASREKPRFTPENVIGQNVTDEGQSIIFTAADNQAHYSLFGSKTLPRNDFQFQFSAQASNDVHVAMQCYQGARSDIAYEIVFGGWGNTRSVIRMGTQGKELASAKGPRTSANKLMPTGSRTRTAICARGKRATTKTTNRLCRPRSTRSPATASPSPLAPGTCPSTLLRPCTTRTKSTRCPAPLTKKPWTSTSSSSKTPAPPSNAPSMTPSRRARTSASRKRWKR